MILWLKDCLTEKNASRNGKVNLTKTEIVFIVVHLKSGHYLTVVQRFKVAFIQEIWFTHTGDREIHSVSGKLPHYPWELACMMLYNLFA